MKLTFQQQKFLISSSSKALATGSRDTLNVIPVSTMFIIKGGIILVNYFMNKTLKNILQHPHIALTCWTGCEGIQIKGIANYQTQGGIFDYVCEQISHTNPERIVHGVILITPHSLFDISLPKNSKNKKTTN